MPRFEELLDADQMQRAAEGGARFERNDFMERLIEMRATRPKSFGGLSPAAKLALSHYEAAAGRMAARCKWCEHE